MSAVSRRSHTAVSVMPSYNSMFKKAQNIVNAALHYFSVSTQKHTCQKSVATQFVLLVTPSGYFPSKIYCSNTVAQCSAYFN